MGSTVMYARLSGTGEAIRSLLRSNASLDLIQDLVSNNLEKIFSMVCYTFKHALCNHLEIGCIWLTEPD